ncbi:thiamine-phosphate pyrophosphorylase [Halostagnicola larsenii XH-48]|uniref:Thiamine-phosphate synthase n=1 Tax=Halostagnicola larsenii XH-48 TaxID=797299 RepID=W0JMJ8_9EURY|nr:thiamine phosphate synthase [Halostagnicola larsenii]AHF98384.1 thiamine-phosphate pyrophosphorylase [Halostagnicola larsenii XH-48]
MNPSTWRTYLVTQSSLSGDRSTPEIVRAAIDGGIDAVQLRDKGLEARDRYEIGLECKELTDAAGVDLIVNDRVDLARAIDADGVHLGQSDLPVAVARDLLGPDAIIGCSTSTVAEATRAEADGADYLGVGAVYGTSSKDVEESKDGIGPERIREIVDSVSIPVVGIGGITVENAGPVVQSGATGVAVISAITAADDPFEATESLVEAVESVLEDARGTNGRRVTTGETGKAVDDGGVLE